MSSKINSIPNIRFPKFTNDKNWDIIKLEKLVKIRSGYSPSNYDLKKSGTYPFLKVEDLNNCRKYQFKSRNYAEDEKNTVPKESIIFPKRGASILLNKVRINKLDVLMDSNLMAITPNNKVNNEFLYYTIDKVKLSKIADTSTIPQINNKHILPFEINVPNREEQKKIVDCLGSIDSLISAKSQKVDLLIKHKKGLLQNIFPKDDNSTPKLRFPEFKNKEEWKEETLKNLFNFLRGSKLSKTDIIESGINKCVHYGELFTVYRERILTIKSSTNEKIGQFSHEGDILMPSSDVTPEGLATASAIFKEDVILGGDINILRPKKEVSSLFISYFLNSNKKEIMKLVTGTTVKHIYNKDISKLKIKIPSLEEQNKIADCLSSIDHEIDLQKQKVKVLKEHKKSLLQQLFPSNEEF